MGIDWTSAWEAGQHKSTAAPAPVATPSPSPEVLAEKPAATTPAPVAPVVATTVAAPVAPVAPPASSASPSSSNDIVGAVEAGAASLFNGLTGISNEITAFGMAVANTGAVVSATGNEGSPQGSNMIKVSSTEGYDFTNTFINSQSDAITVAIWNKAFNGDPNLGACVAPKTPILTFALAPGEKQIVAFQDGSLVGWAQATSKTTMAGQFDITWGEGKFTSEGSGYDVSAIVNSGGNNYAMAINAGETPCISSNTQNYWMAKDGNPEDPIPIGNSDGSCYVPGNSATLTTNMGGFI